MLKLCPNCQQKTEAGSDFCPACGQDLDSVSLSQETRDTEEISPAPNGGSAAGRIEAGNTPALSSRAPTTPVKQERAGSIESKTPAFKGVRSQYSPPQVVFRPPSPPQFEIPEIPPVRPGFGGPGARTQDSDTLPVALEIEQLPAAVSGNGGLVFYFRNLTGAPLKSCLFGTVQGVQKGEFCFNFDCQPHEADHRSHVFEVQQPGSKVLDPCQAIVLLKDSSGHSYRRFGLEEPFHFTVEHVESAGGKHIVVHGNFQLSGAAQVFGPEMSWANRKIEEKSTRRPAKLVPKPLGRVADAAALNRLHTAERAACSWPAGASRDRLALDCRFGANVRRLFVFAKDEILIGRNAGSAERRGKEIKGSDIVLRFTEKVPEDVSVRKTLNGLIPGNAWLVRGDNVSQPNVRFIGERTCAWIETKAGGRVHGADNQTMSVDATDPACFTDRKARKLSLHLRPIEVDGAREEIAGIEHEHGRGATGADLPGKWAGALMERKGDLEQHMYLMLFRRVKLGGRECPVNIIPNATGPVFALYNLSGEIRFSPTDDTVWTLNGDPVILGEVLPLVPGDVLSSKAGEIRVKAVDPQDFIDRAE